MKSLLGIKGLHPRESEMNFAFLYSVNRSIQDLSVHGASKEPKDPVFRI